ncbi:hypothetical protein K7X08_028922 [Anisodus acutangulus]|uniref:Uncharacterized protein n=1 Tax=Anisodus acutangulus TaxID=402998 RepID=A0A9Q1QVF4_9SOLA|nr:hypothetical protein K7X08_028922 [Anisodus acutangulus]
MEEIYVTDKQGYDSVGNVSLELKEDFESSGSVSAIHEWERFYALICHDYEAHWVYINSDEDILALENKEILENTRDVSVDFAAIREQEKVDQSLIASVTEGLNLYIVKYLVPSSEFAPVAQVQYNLIGDLMKNLTANDKRKCGTEGYFRFDQHVLPFPLNYIYKSPRVLWNSCVKSLVTNNSAILEKILKDLECGIISSCLNIFIHHLYIDGFKINEPFFVVELGGDNFTWSKNEAAMKVSPDLVERIDKTTLAFDIGGSTFAGSEHE